MPTAADVLGACAFDAPDTLDQAVALALEADDEVVAAAAAVLGAASSSLASKVLAAYVYAETGVDAAPLRKALTDDEPTVRFFAASGLVRRGEAAAFETLIALLDVDAPVLGSRPPHRVWQAAARTLVVATARADIAPPADADDLVLADARAAWEAWRRDELPSLQFDPSTGGWTAR